MLNACRRHRRNHSASAAGVCGLWCAQRLSASSKEPPYDPKTKKATKAECSTPVGVIEGTTRNGVQGQAGVIVVLNACRRHRRNHSLAAERVNKQRLCSTPVGVIEGT